jgi:hypothetical protein
MARYLLDTDAIIDHLVGHVPSVALIQELHSRGDALCTCDVVVTELYAGVRPGDREKARRLLAALQLLPTSFDVARQAGEWRYTYARRGRALATTDVLIAATAHAHQATIVTGNGDDYPMPELSLLALPRWSVWSALYCPSSPRPTLG